MKLAIKKQRFIVITFATKFLLELIQVKMLCNGTAVYLRYPNERGPAAIKTGRKCLSTVAEYYFFERYASRTKNMAIMHIADMSVPAAEIELTFLSFMHELIATDKFKGIQLRIISDAYSISDITNVNSNAITLTDYYVIVIDGVEKLHNSMRNFIARSSSYNPGARFLIMFNNPDLRITNGLTGRDLSFDVFNLMYRRFNAANVVICFSSKLLEYEIYISDPYRNTSSCGSLEPILVDLCIDGEMKNKFISKTKLREPRVPDITPGCTFKFCARIAEPYMEDNCTTGLELLILKTLQTSLKFDISTFCTTMPRGERLPNGSWEYLLGMLRNDQCDFVVGGFFPDNEVHVDFGVTTTYLDDSYTWYVCLPDLREPWQGLIMIFQPTTWLVFVLILILAIIAWYIFGCTTLERIQQKQIIVVSLNAWSVFLGHSANNRPDYTPLRVFFIVLALYGLNVTTIYTSNLINMFTEPKYQKQIETIDEIIENELPIGGRIEYSDWFVNDNPHDQIIEDLYQFTDTFLPSLENLNRVIYCTQSMLMNRFYVLSTGKQKEMYEIKGNVFSNQLEMIAERGFPLLKKFNTLISLLKDSGIIQKIHDDFIHNQTYLKNIQNYKQEQEEQIVLTIDHLQGAFAILILGYLISFIIFIVEILSSKKQFQFAVRTVKRKWTNLLILLKLQEKPLKMRKKY